MTRRGSDNDALPHRQRLRLTNYDYSQPGAYFVTICAFGRACLFGHAADSEVQLSEIGRVTRERWLAIPTHHPGVDLDAFVVMPNHVHGIVRIIAGRNRGDVAATTVPLSSRSPRGPAPNSLGAIVGSFKAGVTRTVGRMHESRSDRIWQPGYHEHVIRDDASMERIRQYIADNPARWVTDPENPNRTAAATQASPLHPVTEPWSV